MSQKLTEIIWGQLEATEHYGRETSPMEKIIIDRHNLDSKYEDKITYQACHVLIYAKTDKKMFGLYDIKANILMQVRFDGFLGFPGGLVDPGENCEDALNRELSEEMKFNLQKYSIKTDNHVVSHFNTKTGLLTHFYILEVTEDDLKQIETDALQARDYGSEVLGTFRIPLYTMGDGYRGFPVFLKHQFINNAKEQLLFGIKKLGLLNDDEIKIILEATPKTF